MRAYGERCGKKREIVFPRIFGGAEKTQIKATIAAASALGFLFKPAYRVKIKLGQVPVVRDLNALAERSALTQLIQRGEPLVIFLPVGDVRIAKKDRNIKIFCQIFEHIRRARSAAGVKQQPLTPPIGA